MMDTLTPLTDEQRKLVEDNWLLSMFFLNKLKQQYPFDEETLYDWVTEAAIRAAQVYDPAKGSWTAIYNWKLKGVIHKFMWNETHRLKGESLDDDAPGETPKRTKHDVRGGPCQELEDAISKIAIEQTMDSLHVTKNQQKYIMDLAFTDKPLQSDIAKKYGVERQAVTDALTRVKKRFKKAVAKRGGAKDWIL